MENAVHLHAMGQYRAAVMEAFTALEERVAEVVFDQLEHQARLPRELVSWLKEKSKYSFEDRLHPIGAYALGKHVDKGSGLWSDYKKAKRIRNDVSHTARQVSAEEAITVINTVREWLEFVQGAKEDPKGFHESDAVRDFFHMYSVLFSRFSDARSRGQLDPRTPRQIVDAGPFSVSEKEALHSVVDTRNALAHGHPVSKEQYERALDALRKSLQNLKVREF